MADAPVVVTTVEYVTNGETTDTQEIEGLSEISVMGAQGSAMYPVKPDDTKIRIHFVANYANVTDVEKGYPHVEKKEERSEKDLKKLLDPDADTRPAPEVRASNPVRGGETAKTEEETR